MDEPSVCDVVRWCVVAFLLGVFFAALAGCVRMERFGAEQDPCVRADVEASVAGMADRLLGPAVGAEVRARAAALELECARGH